GGDRVVEAACDPRRHTPPPVASRAPFPTPQKANPVMYKLAAPPQIARGVARKATATASPLPLVAGVVLSEVGAVGGWAIDCGLHRARSASRSRSSPGAVRGKAARSEGGKSVEAADESATGSVNLSRLTRGSFWREAAS